MPATAQIVPPVNASQDRALPGGSPFPRAAQDGLNAGDTEGIALFAGILRQTGYPGSSSQESLGQQLGALHRRRDLPLYLRRLQGPPALKTLAKLFAFQAPVPEYEVREALAPLDLERCVEMGLVFLDSGDVCSRINISACDKLFIAHDPAGGDPRQETPAEHVLGISPPTLVLARLALREQARTALDLGTGCGVQALMAASHCGRVIGTDINSRALSFARFNAILNGVENVEFRFGSLFEPVAGEKFDLIISNPPYVISPESTLLFRDGGRKADGFCEHLVRTLPEHLNERGFACMLANWAHYADEHWSTPIRRWVEKSGCDCWALHGQEHEPLAYAADWNRNRERAAYERALEEWTAYYETLGIRSISSGGIVLRRATGGPNWFRADELGTEMHPLSASIVRVFAVEDYLRRASDEDLLAEKFSLQPTHKLTQVMVPAGEDYAVESMRLETTHYPPFAASMDQHALHLLRGCNGARTLREILAELAQAVGAEERACQERGLQIVRGLLANGVLGAQAPHRSDTNKTTKG